MARVSVRCPCPAPPRLRAALPPRPGPVLRCPVPAGLRGPIRPRRSREQGAFPGRARCAPAVAGGDLPLTGDLRDNRGEPGDTGRVGLRVRRMAAVRPGRGGHLPAAGHFWNRAAGCARAVGGAGPRLCRTCSPLPGPGRAVRGQGPAGRAGAGVPTYLHVLSTGRRGGGRGSLRGPRPRRTMPEPAAVPRRAGAGGALSGEAASPSAALIHCYFWPGGRSRAGGRLCLPLPPMARPPPAPGPSSP